MAGLLLGCERRQHSGKLCRVVHSSLSVGSARVERFTSGTFNPPFARAGYSYYTSAVHSSVFVCFVVTHDIVFVL